MGIPQACVRRGFGLAELSISAHPWIRIGGLLMPLCWLETIRPLTKLRLSEAECLNRNHEEVFSSSRTNDEADQRLFRLKGFFLGDRM